MNRCGTAPGAKDRRKSIVADKIRKFRTNRPEGRRKPRLVLQVQRAALRHAGRAADQCVAPVASSHFSQSIAAAQPEPAAVIAWR
jgi:hypothetical protein